MGLDTRAYKPATDEWKRQWAEQTNRAGVRPRMWGLMEETLTEPVTAKDAPEYHQDHLGDLPWSGGLVGGMLSGNGKGPSFRGKVYDGYVEAVTGFSLYAACHDPWRGEVLREVAEKLRAAVDSGPEYSSEPDHAEREALARWFEVCVENGLAVGGDY